jgi:hypothetical protein
VGKLADPEERSCDRPKRPPTRLQFCVELQKAWCHGLQSAQTRILQDADRGGVVFGDAGVGRRGDGSALKEGKQKSRGWRPKDRRSFSSPSSAGLLNALSIQVALRQANRHSSIALGALGKGEPGRGDGGSAATASGVPRVLGRHGYRQHRQVPWSGT